MKDKIVLVTGSTDGIGKETALQLAQLGATVIVHGRNAERCQNTRDEIRQATGNPDGARRILRYAWSRARTPQEARHGWFNARRAQPPSVKRDSMPNRKGEDSHILALSITVTAPTSLLKMDANPVHPPGAMSGYGTSAWAAWTMIFGASIGSRNLSLTSCMVSRVTLLTYCPWFG